MESPSIKLSSMYFYVEKVENNTIYDRPATEIAKTTTGMVMAQPRGHRSAGRSHSLEDQKLAKPVNKCNNTKTNILPILTTYNQGSNTMLLDPGMDLTLKPMRYPQYTQNVPRCY